MRQPAPAVDDPTQTTSYMVMRSLSEAALECGLPEERLRRWIAAGILPAVTIGGRPMVNAAEVAALRDRRVGETGGAAKAGGTGRRWRARRRRGTRALGAANAVAGLAGCLVFVGIGPADLRTPGWLAACLASLLVGLLLWRVAASPTRRRPRRRA